MVTSEINTSSDFYVSVNNSNIFGENIFPTVGSNVFIHFGGFGFAVCVATHIPPIQLKKKSIGKKNRAARTVTDGLSKFS